jgi:hypothetical protein
LAVGLAANIPVILWGKPGVGKTSVVEQIAAHHGWWLETVIASISDPTDFKGMPREESGRTVFSAPAWAHAIADARGGLVFLDEISTAPPSVQAALLRPVLSRVVGELPLPPETRFVAAANPPDLAADGWDLSAPLANRFLHLEWDVPADVIGDGLAFGYEPIEVPAATADRVAAATGRVLGMVGTFLRTRPDLMLRVPASAAEQGVAWPSPRSWETGAKALAYARAAKVSKTAQALLLGGCVGVAPAREFLNWERHLDLPDVEKALRGDGRLDLPDGPDKVMAVCGALAAAVLANPTRRRCEAAINGTLVQVARAGHVDLAAVALRRISPAAKGANAQLSPEAFDTFTDLVVMIGRLAGGSAA